MSTDKIIEQKGEALCDFIKVTNQMADFCRNNMEEAKDIYYSLHQRGTYHFDG